MRRGACQRRELIWADVAVRSALIVASSKELEATTLPQPAQQNWAPSGGLNGGSTVGFLIVKT